MQTATTTPPSRRIPALAVQMDNGFSIIPVREPRSLQREILKLQCLAHVAQIDTGTLPAHFGKAATGHKAFDAKTNANYFGTGNVYANTLFGQFVRPRGETACNGREFDLGQLQNSDLTWFNRTRDFNAVARYIEREIRFYREWTIAYGVFHWRGKERITHGALVTDTQRRLVRTFERSELGLSHAGKSSDVLAWAVQELTDQCLANRETVWSRH